ncbi:XYLOGLUCAN ENDOTRANSGLUCOSYLASE/HYDROLASE PROTEIN 8-RELATED [Salix purpurea]|uniref:Xyloglucan endotransglucosylase/hydrolase n=1 Tax=Salix purpurea TaxID=77065 RepID=A0A9Q0W3D1_SALPP|nr:XYLOGLUCAN ENDOTRANSGLUCOSYLASE/HYDROLASE PROTEIN 8-RELATED [Salix purpurea]
MLFNISCRRFLILCTVLLPPCVFGFSSHGLPTSSFNESFVRLFGNDHVVFLDDGGKSVEISLDRSSGSGFASQLTYLYSYFSASVKLPGNYTAGVVVTYYTSNAAEHKTNHDEIDFEFLGNTGGNPWTLQTNLYGNGSTSRGREERYALWFDPTQDFHAYSILWTSAWIVYYVDDVPVRVVRKVDAMGGDFPSKAMTLLATIWDGSDWATGGGRNKVDYKHAPFIAKYSDFVLYGCHANPAGEELAADQTCGDIAADLNTFNGLTAEERGKMENFRVKNLMYSYCNDRSRYPTPLPECNAGGKSS